MSKKIKFNGETFGSLSELARNYGMDEDTVLHRNRKLNWSIEESLGLVERKRKYGESGLIEFRGDTYGSISELARAYSKDETKVYSRIRKLKWSIEESLDLVERKRKSGARKVTAFSKPFDSVAQMLKYYNVETSQFHYFHKEKGSGMSVEDALIECFKRRGVTKKKKVTEYVVFGEPFKTRKEIAEHYKISYWKLNHLMGDKEMNVEDAIHYIRDEKNKRKKKYFVFGDYYTSIKECCDYFGLDHKYVYTRLRSSGRSLEEVLIEELRKFV